ncbi:MAG: VanZ family protein [Clostridia bacterium]|nr:VanZ family protein [Clostridia bacterium]
MRHKVPFCILIALILLLLLSIFMFSDQDSDQSSNLSRQVSVWLANFLNPTYMKSAKESTQNHVIKFLSLPVRKGAHMGEYALLGALLMCAMLCLRLKMWLRMLLSFVSAVIFAMADEFHQTFVTGRSGEIRDILFDSTGAALGILFVWILSLAVLYAIGCRRLKNAGKGGKRKPNHTGYRSAPPPN